jgi:hypothetical protein
VAKHAESLIENHFSSKNTELHSLKYVWQMNIVQVARVAQASNNSQGQYCHMAAKHDHTDGGRIQANLVPSDGRHVMPFAWFI